MDEPEGRHCSNSKYHSPLGSCHLLLCCVSITISECMEVLRQQSTDSRVHSVSLGAGQLKWHYLGIGRGVLFPVGLAKRHLHALSGIRNMTCQQDWFHALSGWPLEATSGIYWHWNHDQTNSTCVLSFERILHRQPSNELLIFLWLGLEWSYDPQSPGICAGNHLVPERVGSQHKDLLTHPNPHGGLQVAWCSTWQPNTRVRGMHVTCGDDHMRRRELCHAVVYSTLIVRWVGFGPATLHSTKCIAWVPPRLRSRC
jgi:hypothetical protein